MFRFRPFFLIMVLSIGGVASQWFLEQCEGTCEIEFEATCDVIAALYDFTGDCCALTTNEKSTCTLISSTDCTHYGRTYPCFFDSPDGFGCLTGLEQVYTAMNSTDECPASEIDVLSRPRSAHSEWSDLSMLLIGVTEMSADDIKAWEKVTSNHIVNYYKDEGGDVRDVVGYVRLGSTTKTETGDTLVSYYQQCSWRTDDKTFDPTTLAQTPFMSKGAVASYMDALKEVGIPTVGVTMMSGKAHKSIDEEGPTVSRDVDFYTGNEDKNEPEGNGGGYGDPHLKTWTGLVYDFHGECDLVLVKSESFDNGQGLALHIRTTMRHDWSFISAAALRIGDEILEVRSKGLYWLNGVASALLPAHLAGFPVESEHSGNSRHRFFIDLGHMGKVVIKVFNEFLAVKVEHAHKDGFGDSVGLMGTFHGGYLMSREGHMLSNYAEFGMDWQVRDTEPMLFQEVVRPQYPQVCHMPLAAAMKHRARQLSETKISLEQATRACGNRAEESRESCIYDVMLTGNLEMALTGS